MSEAAIEASNLSKVYWDGGKKLEIFRGLSFAAAVGESLAIWGPSGSGKTTLLNILSGLDRADSGEIWIGKDKLSDLDEAARAEIRRSRVGFVFQSYHLMPELTAIENVLLPARIASKPLAAATERAKSLLDRVGLSERENHFPNQLSGGEQQRVALARALMNDPGILMCDEPTGNLDVETGRKIWDLLITMTRADKKTLVVVTHDERFARIADRVWDMIKKVRI